MTNIVVFSFCDNYYNIVVNTKTKSFKLLEENNYFDYVNDLNEEKYLIKVVELKPSIFNNLVLALGDHLDENVSNFKYKGSVKYIFLQNECNDKLIINESKNEFMVNNFVCNTNEVDYIKIPNNIFQIFINVLGKSYYTEVEFDNSYFITKDHILDNFDDIILNKSYKYFYMIERYDYFNIDKIKEYYIKYYNGELKQKLFNSFNQFMSILFKYHPSKLKPRDKKIYEELGQEISESIGIKSKSEISSLFASINYLYNELHDITNYKKFIYYVRTYYNDLYYVLIIDYECRKYWIGYINEPIFSFDEDYIDFEVNENIKDRTLYRYENLSDLIQEFIYDYEDFCFSIDLPDKYFKKE